MTRLVPASRLMRPAPPLHRALHVLTAAGLRGAPRLWRLALRLQRAPDAAWWSPDGRIGVGLRPRAPLQEAELALYQGHYEWAERHIVQRLVRPGTLCVDVGASFGVYTVLLASLAGERGRVVACEPSPVALGRLEPLVAALPQVDLQPVAIGARSRQGTLVVAAGDSMHSSLRAHCPPSGRRVTVEIRPLIDVIPERAEVEFIKVDVEGGEADVLAGMSTLLDERRIACAMFEVEPRYGNVEWTGALAARDGYRLYRVEPAPIALWWRSRLRPLAACERHAGSVFLVREDRVCLEIG